MIIWIRLGTRFFCFRQATVRDLPCLSYCSNESIPDTVAHTLDAAFALLALHQDFQEEVYQELVEVMPTEADFVSHANSGERSVANQVITRPTRTLRGS